MPQENIMAPHDLGTKKMGAENNFLFSSFFCFQSRTIFIYILFFNLVVGRGHNEI